MNLSLDEKTAVVCGSTQGIGLAIAEQLALLGASCILIARREEALKEAVALLDIGNRQLHTYQVADFTRPDQVKEIIYEIVSKQVIHILINNTGGPSPGPIIDASEEDFMQAFKQHLICNHILTKAVIPGMKEAGYGRIINIISISVKAPLKNLGVSNTIRGAVASWAKTMAIELGQFNITVNNILPGYIKTSRLDALNKQNAEKRKLRLEEIENELIEDIPVKRFGEAMEIAAVAGFLASPVASYVNGISIPVDGGKTGSI